nr:MAG TPA: hypothetical protein [Caudoviricetes sp.]
MATTIPDEWLTPQGFSRLYREGGETFRTFARQVYDYLETMHPGRSVTFRRYQGSPKLEWCVRTAALFLLTADHWLHYDLMDDRITIRRHHTHTPHHPAHTTDPQPPSAKPHAACTDTTTTDKKPHLKHLR